MKTAAGFLTTAVVLSLAIVVLGNGGPFVIKYPDGDPAAKGVLARLDENLTPKTEDRLRVIREDLSISIAGPEPAPAQSSGKGAAAKASPSLPPTPLASVSAAYTIENPTGEDITVDFGFPILRGVFVIHGMGAYPDVHVQMQEAGKEQNQHVYPRLISNSAIYGLIRHRARETVDGAIRADAGLAALVKTVQSAESDKRASAKAAVVAYATETLKWEGRDANLLGEYTVIELGKPDSFVRTADTSPFHSYFGTDADGAVTANLGSLGAIGEQKATQFLAQLAGKFDPKAASTYESIFAAWGGDVQEKSVDLETGKLRPRVVTVDSSALPRDPYRWGDSTVGSDPTVYARVDYFDDSMKLPEDQKASCKTILKNLPVVFTFAPMNLLYYQAKFPAKSTWMLTVSYRQYTFRDTAAPASYQLAYVVHPASLWKQFGPIHLSVKAPEGVAVRASVPVQIEEKDKAWHAILPRKTGELLVAVKAADWNALATPAQQTPNSGKELKSKVGK